MKDKPSKTPIQHLICTVALVISITVLAITVYNNQYKKHTAATQSTETTVINASQNTKSDANTDWIPINDWISYRDLEPGKQYYLEIRTYKLEKLPNNRVERTLESTSQTPFIAKSSNTEKTEVKYFMPKPTDSSISYRSVYSLKTTRKD